MAGPGFQLTQPMSGPTGYRLPDDALGDFHLRMDPALTRAIGGWGALLDDGRMLPISGHVLPTLDDLLRPAAASLLPLMPPAFGPVPPPVPPTPQIGKLLDNLADFTVDRMRNAYWPGLTVPGTRKALGGGQATTGMVDPSGLVRPGEVDGAVTGDRWDQTWFMDPIRVARRVGFVNQLDLHFEFWLDREALERNRPAWLFSGAAATLEGTTQAGTKMSFRVGLGRDQQGASTGFFVFGVGPDIPPDLVTPPR